MSNPSELTLLVLQLGFLLLMWIFVFAIVYALRSDLFGQRVRKMQTAPAAEAAPAAPVASAFPTSPGAAPAAAAPSAATAASTENASRLVITSGPKAGLELPLGTEPMTIGRSSESGLVIRDDYTSSHHARLLLRGDAWAIQDLDSTNGTFLSGKRLTGSPTPISIGDTVKVGATTFELRA